jgi:colicin import membrane protein
LFLLLREYSLPVLFALLLHTLALFFLYSGWQPQQDNARLIKPQIIRAKLLVLEPKAAPVKSVAARQREIAPPEVRPQPDLSAQRRQREAESARQEAIRQEAVRQEATRREAAERRERLRLLADSSFVDAVADEANVLDDSVKATATEIAQAYRFGIYQLVVANWSRPPSARNGMEAKLQVELVPTGDVVAVTLLESSGSGAFDRSAEAAVRKARRFEVPIESAIFERYFRRFTLLFRPEDLLR